MIPERIERKILKASSGCWLWLGEYNRNGYGRVKFAGRKLMAHRVIYELVVDQIPDGLVLDHICRNRCCVNPDHLEEVTIRENTLRGDAVLFRCKEEVK